MILMARRARFLYSTAFLILLALLLIHADFDNSKTLDNPVAAEKSAWRSDDYPVPIDGRWFLPQGVVGVHGSILFEVERDSGEVVTRSKGWVELTGAGSQSVWLDYSSFDLLAVYQDRSPVCERMPASAAGGYGAARGCVIAIGAAESPDSLVGSDNSSQWKFRLNFPQAAIRFAGGFAHDDDLIKQIAAPTRVILTARSTIAGVRDDRQWGPCERKERELTAVPNRTNSEVEKSSDGVQQDWFAVIGSTDGSVRCP